MKKILFVALVLFGCSEQPRIHDEIEVTASCPAVISSHYDGKGNLHEVVLTEDGEVVTVHVRVERPGSVRNRRRFV